MIDIQNENLIPILDVRKTVPVSTASLRRWAASGKLETLRIGAKVFTSREAVGRMARHGPQASSAQTSPTRKRRGQLQRLQRVDQELDDLLGVD